MGVQSDFLLKTVFGKARPKNLESVLALHVALSFSDVSAKDGKNSIESNLVLVHSNDSVGSGVRLTEDGFILTAYHTIEDKIPKSHITMNNKEYSVENECFAASPKYDIAIIKANMPGDSKPIKFKARDRLRKGTEVEVVALTSENRIYNQFGRIIKASSSMKFEDESVTSDCFVADTYIAQGFSGGAFVAKGALCGLVLWGIGGSNGNLSYKTSGGSRMRNIYALKNAFVRELGLSLFGR